MRTGSRWSVDQDNQNGETEVLDQDNIYDRHCDTSAALFEQIKDAEGYAEDNY